MLKNRVYPSILAGLLTSVIFLAVEKLQNGSLVYTDYMTALVAGILTGLAIFILLRHR